MHSVRLSDTASSRSSSSSLSDNSPASSSSYWSSASRLLTSPSKTKCKVRQPHRGPERSAWFQRGESYRACNWWLEEHCITKGLVEDKGGWGRKIRGQGPMQRDVRIAAHVRTTNSNKRSAEDDDTHAQGDERYERLRRVGTFLLASRKGWESNSQHVSVVMVQHVRMQKATLSRGTGVVSLTRARPRSVRVRERRECVGGMESKVDPEWDVSQDNESWDVDLSSPPQCYLDKKSADVDQREETGGCTSSE